MLAFGALIPPTHAVGEESARRYFTVTPKELPTTTHTHVCVSGTATLVMREDDGDLHVRIEGADGTSFAVAEEIPVLKATGPRPRKHEKVTACGISREDKKHGWYEVHPVEVWK